MAKSRPILPPLLTCRVQARSQKTDGNGNGVDNEILLRLPANEYDELLPKLEFVRLNLHTVIHEAGEPIKSAYFVNSGLQSVLTVQPDGKSVEVGLIGKEGFVGLPIIDGYRSSPLRIIVQGDSTAYRVDAETLHKILPHSPVYSWSCTGSASDWRCSLPKSPPATASTRWTKDSQGGC